jgi:hypothetical protein
VINARLIVLFAALACLFSCSSGKRISQANDILRRRNHDLEQEVQALKRRNAELESEINAVASQPDDVSPELRAATPHVTEISIGRLTHIRDTDKNGEPDTLMAYVQPVDGRGRFTQMVGTITATVAIVPDEGEAQTIGRTLMDPVEVRDAYRSSFTGQHYLVEVPVTTDHRSASVVVRISYDDGLSGRTLSAERSIQIN